jgi:glycosyltransferase involved in cell wall biosynthesis
MNTANIPLLTVCIITYNHEKFIRETLDSVLMQKTNFAYKILIGEDCSTDSTRDILLEYKQKHPDIIELRLNKKNEGASQNLINIHNGAKTKYVAMLDGDDYWTDPDKLQTQVDFLENNKEYAGYFHRVQFAYTDTGKNTFFPENTSTNSFAIEDIIAMASKGWIIMTSSVVYNKYMVGDLPDWFLKLKIGDIPVNLLIAHAGKEYFSEKAMAAYRVNPGSLMTTEEYSDYSLIKERISAYNFFNRHTGKIYDTAIKKELTVKYYQLVKYCHEKNRPVAKVYYTVLHNYYSIGLKNNKPRSFKEKINISLNYLRFIFKNVYP